MFLLVPNTLRSLTGPPHPPPPRNTLVPVISFLVTFWFLITSSVKGCLKTGKPPESLVGRRQRGESRTGVHNNVPVASEAP